MGTGFSTSAKTGARRFKSSDLFPVHVSGLRFEARDRAIALPELYIVAVDELGGARDRGVIICAVNLNHADRYAVSSDDKGAICRHPDLPQRVAATGQNMTADMFECDGDRTASF